MSLDELARDLIEHTVEKTFSLDRFLERLEIKEFPSPAQQQYLRLLRNIVEWLRGTLLAPKEMIAGSGNLAIRTVKRKGEFISFLHEFAAHIEKSDTSYVHWGLAETIQAIASRFGSNFGIIIRPTWMYNYGFEEILSELKNITEPLTDEKLANIFQETARYDWLVLLDFPAAEKDNILLNCTLFHEVGHFIYRINHMASRIADKVEIDDAKVIDLVKRARAEFVGMIGKPQGKQTEHTGDLLLYLYRAPLADAALKLSRYWIEELVSDMIAVHLAGPAYFYAFTQLVSSEKLDIGVRDHPPSEWRIELLVDELEYCGYPGVDKQLAQYVKKWSDHVAGTSSKSSKVQPIPHPLEGIVRDAVEKLTSSIKEQARLVVKDKEYSAKLYAKEVPPTVSILENAVPSIEIMNNERSSFAPVDMVSILNGGWTTKLHGMEKLYPLFGAEKEIERFEVKHKLNHWILHALEIRAIQGSLEKL